VAKLSQILKKDGYANLQSVESQNIGEGKSINPKLAIKLNKSANFDALTANIIPK
jgi:hypothetical protein